MSGWTRIETAIGHTMKSRLAWDQRAALYLRLVPAVVLAVFYLSIAAAKASGAARDGQSAFNGEWVSHALGATHAASGAIFFAILGVVMLVRKEPIRRERRLIGWLLPLAVMTSLAYVGGAPLQGFSAPVMFVATLLVVVGTAFTIYALRHLGRHFGVVSDVRGLVTSGSYRWVRHPLYAGETITMVGFVIAVATPVTVAAFLLGTGLQIWRAKVEEQSLTAAFPEYREYAARTPMLIPFTKFPSRTFRVPSAVEHQH
jgi:protein-S-isoprenylcysteine O-methyltransferase Ste14